MPSIDLHKTLIIQTLIENKDSEKWEKLFEINKKILNHFGYENIYLLRAKPQIVISEKYHGFQRAELFLYQDMEILKNYDYVIYTEIDAFLIKPIDEFQKLCDGVKEEAIMFSDYEEIIRRQHPKIMFCLFSVKFYKKFLSYFRKEFEIIKKIGHEKYKNHCIDMFPRCIICCALDEDLIWSNIIKKHKLKEIVNLDCISPNKKEHLKYFVNSRFTDSELVRSWPEKIFPDDKKIEYSLEIILNQIFFLHVLEIEHDENNFFFEYLKENIEIDDLFKI